MHGLYALSEAELRQLEQRAWQLGALRTQVAIIREQRRRSAARWEATNQVLAAVMAGEDMRCAR